MPFFGCVLGKVKVSEKDTWVDFIKMFLLLFSTINAQKNNFYVKDFFIKWEKIHWKLQICLYLLKTSPKTPFLYCVFHQIISSFGLNETKHQTFRKNKVTNDNKTYK